jgi:hypothetical protein
MAQPLIEIDARAALRSFGRIGPALQRGTVRGLNDVAFQSMRFEKGQMPRRLDRPSSFTAKGVQVDRAAATQGTPEATVKVSDQRAKYLAMQEFGGELNKGNAASTRGSGSDAIVVPVAEKVRDQLGGAGRNAVRRALKLPRTYLTRTGVYQRNGSGRLGTPLLRFFQRVTFGENLHFRDDVGGFAQPRIRAAVAMRVDRELSRAVRV